MFWSACSTSGPLLGQIQPCIRTSYSPTREDVERYRRFRALNTALNHQIVKTIPRRAFEEIGDALGIRHNGILVFDSEDMTSVMMDCCLHDWHENGKNLVQRYAETHAPAPGTDEGYLLQALLHAEYRVLVPQSAVPGAGLLCRDVLSDEELFLMDIAFSRTFRCGTGALATRTIQLGEFWMTGGAALPIDHEADIPGAMRRIQTNRYTPPKDSAIVALSIVRACLAAGAADHIMYASPQAASKKPRRNKPGWRGTKRLRR